MAQTPKSRYLYPLVLCLAVFLGGCTGKLNATMDKAEQDVAEPTDGGTIEVSIRVALNRSTKTGPSDSAAPTKSESVEVSIPYTVSGTAENPDLHNLVASTLIIPPGQSYGNIKFFVKHNGVYLGDRTIIVTLQSATGAELGGNLIHTVNIIESDPAPPVSFLLSARTVSEGAGTISVDVALGQASPVDATVALTFSGDASSADYTLPLQTLTIPAGETTATIAVPLTDDLLLENDEDIVITLSDPFGATIGSTPTFTLHIVDNDNQPTVTMSSAGQTVSEAVGTVSFTFDLSAASGLDVDIPYVLSGTATAGVDHNQVDGTARIPAGDLSVTISVAITNDAFDEPDETAIFTMDTPVNANAGATAVHTITIQDNDNPPTVQFQAASQTVSEAVGSVTVTATLSAASGRNVTVPFTLGGTAINPTDHNLVAGNISILAGANSGTTTFNVVNDALYELTDTVILTMGAPTNASLGATTVHTVNITDNDSQPNINFSAAAQAVAESAGTVTITANLSAVSGVATSTTYSVAGTSASGTDHDLSAGTITVPAGSLSANLTFNVVADTMYEPNETVIVAMLAPTNGAIVAPATHTVTINNDDAIPTVNFSALSQVVPESTGTVYVIAVLSNASYLNASFPFTVGGTSSNPADHDLAAGTLTILAGSTLGQTTFNVVDDGATEASETAILTMGATTNCTAGTTTVHTVNITDNDRQFDTSRLRHWLRSDRSLTWDENQQLKAWQSQSPEAGSLLWKSSGPTHSPSIFPALRFSKDTEFPEWLGHRGETDLNQEVLWTSRKKGSPFELNHYRNADAGSWLPFPIATLLESATQSSLQALVDSLTTPPDLQIQEYDLGEVLVFESPEPITEVEAEKYLAEKYGIPGGGKP